MIAMMLPSVTPTVLLYSALLRRGSSPVPSRPSRPPFSPAILSDGQVSGRGDDHLNGVLEAAGLVSATMMTLIDTVPGALWLLRLASTSSRL